MDTKSRNGIPRKANILQRQVGIEECYGIALSIQNKQPLHINIASDGGCLPLPPPRHSYPFSLPLLSCGRASAITLPISSKGEDMPFNSAG
jgi:hypothetical protein